MARIFSEVSAVRPRRRKSRGQTPVPVRDNARGFGKIGDGLGHDRDGLFDSKKHRRAAAQPTVKAHPRVRAVRPYYLTRHPIAICEFERDRAPEFEVKIVKPDTASRMRKIDDPRRNRARRHAARQHDVGFEPVAQAAF